MKLAILLLAFSLAVLSSCTTSYRTGQTPDDVYYSPVRPQEEYVKSERQDEQTPRYNDDYYEERYLRMKVRNRTRWSDLDDWYYNDYRNRYNVYLGCCFCSNSWTPYSHWNNYYNPYYQNYVIVKNVSPVYSKPRNFNLNAYNTNNSNTRNYSNPKTTGSSTSGTNNTYTAPRNSTTNKRTDSGNRLRDIFERSNTSSTSSSSTSGSSNSGSTTTPSSSSSSSSSSGSSGSSQPAPVRRF